MTDTGQVPSEEQLGHAGAQPQARQPDASDIPFSYPATGPAPAAEEPYGPGEDEDLLMPGARGAWSERQGVTAVPGAPATANQETNTREDVGRGAHAADPPAHRVPQQPAQPAAAATAPDQRSQSRTEHGQTRRPPHLGPPVPEHSGTVRSLADRGPSVATPPSAASPQHPDAAAQSTSDEEPSASRPQQEDLTTGTGPETPHGDVPAGENVSAQEIEVPDDSLTGPNLAAMPLPTESETSGEPEPVAAEAPPEPRPDTSSTEPEAVLPQAVPDESAGHTGTAPGGASEPPLAGGDDTPAAIPSSGQESAPATEPAETPVPQERAGTLRLTQVPEEAAARAITEEATPSKPRRGTVDAFLQEDPPLTDVPPTSVTSEDAEPSSEVGEPAPTAEGSVGQGEGGQGAGGVSPSSDEPLHASDPTPAQSDNAPEDAPDVAEDPSDATAATSAGHPRTPTDQAPRQDAEGQASRESEGHDGASTNEGDAPVEDPRPPEGDDVANPAVEPVAPAAEAETVSAPGGPQVPEETHADHTDAPTPPVQPETETETEPEPRDAVAEPEPADAVTEAPEPGAAQPQVPDPLAPPIRQDGPGETVVPSSEDTTPEQATDRPVAPGFDAADREAVHRLMRERRDIRNGFRPDPIEHDVLLRVLEAAHTAPSVGHSQPWDFVIIRSEKTRRAMHELAERQREVYAQSLPKARAKQFQELKVEAILDTPVNIVVTADSTRGGRHTLGRQTQPQMAPYSSALAVENLWLAARAEGLGVGWVSFFDEREMVHALDLPEHLEVVAYLCIGHVDEFPEEPELTQAGWSKRRPLSWVVHEESYGRRALPGAEPHDLLAETLERIRPLDAKALGEAWERQKRMTKPAGALGMLEIISAQLCGLSRRCPPPVPEPAAVAVFAGDHGVHAAGVTPWPQEVTAQMVTNFLEGGAVCNAFANQVGTEVCVIDVGVAAELPSAPGLLPRKVRAGTADMTQGAALTRDEVLRALEIGIETARDLVAAGNKMLLTGEMGIANTTAAATLVAACTGADPTEVTGRGTGISDETHSRKVDVVRRALHLHQPDPADPVGLLAAVGGLEHAALTGFLLGGASLRTPVLLDGLSAGAAALVARQIAPEALAACVAGHRSAEPGHVAALTKLGLRPLIDLDLRLGEGTGALLALPMVQSAARAMHEVATFDSAGVSEKD